MSVDIQPINPIKNTHQLTFPPFPLPPEGVPLMSFKEFKERGIRVEPGPDDAEVDALGIPTIPLRVRHTVDQCKTNTKRKRQAEEVAARKKAGMSTQRDWWEEWEDTEMIRFSTGFNPNSTRFERIQAAAQDFTNGRKWPVNFASETGPRFIWEKFQRYIGIPEGSQTLKEKKKGDDDLSDDEMDDDEDEDDASVLDKPMEAIVSNKSLSTLTANKKMTAGNEEKLFEFFTNPEHSIRIFMSSYARRMGYIWAEKNLICIPRIIGFFVNFLLRSKVLPEVDRSLRRSLDVIALGLIELPNIANISKNTPDKFSLACTAYWSNKAESYSIVIPDAAEENIPPPTTSEPQAYEKQQLGNEEPSVVETNVAAPDNGWGSATGTWGDTTNTDSANPWGILPRIPDAGDDDIFASWTNMKQEDFFQFLGPTVLPLTHKTGIVERSMRRVKSVAGPNNNPPKAAPQADGVYEPDADAVEVDLDRELTKIVLSPLIDWDGGEYPLYARPTILQTSQGPVVTENGVPETSAGTSGAKPHDPVNDDITLLVEAAEAANFFKEGMAIGGTWVQLARQGEPAKKKKKSKSKSKKAFNGYWYLDEVAIITPSFWAVSKPV